MSKFWFETDETFKPPEKEIIHVEPGFFSKEEIDIISSDIKKHLLTKNSRMVFAIRQDTDGTYEWSLTGLGEDEKIRYLTDEEVLTELHLIKDHIDLQIEELVVELGFNTKIELHGIEALDKIMEEDKDDGDKA